MKYFLTTFCLILFCSTVLANPFYQEGKDVVRDKDIYDYNVKLWKKLDINFDKKYIVSVVKDKDGNITTTYNYPTGAFQREVIDKYYDLKKEY